VAGVARRGEDNSDIMARLFASWQQIERSLPCGRRRCELVRVRSESARSDHTERFNGSRQHSVQGRSVPNKRSADDRFNAWEETRTVLQWVRAHSAPDDKCGARPCFISPLCSASELGCPDCRHGHPPQYGLISVEMLDVVESRISYYLTKVTYYLLLCCNGTTRGGRIQIHTLSLS